jgi:methyl-accepting chemotaxis protein
MMFGILGTFLGLAAMVQEIHLGLPSETANLSLDSWMSSVQQLGSVLGGMKTAFSTSLVGMTGAILSSSVAYWIGHRRRQVFELLERKTAAELVPATVPAVEDESLLVQVSNQLDDSFSRLDEIYRQNQDALKDLTGAQKAFVEIVDEVRDITRGQAARNLDGLLGQLAQASESVLAVSRQIPRVVSTFESTARELRGSAEQIHRSAVRSASRTDLVLGLRPVTWLAIIGAAVVLVGLARVLNAL